MSGLNDTYLTTTAIVNILHAITVFLMFIVVTEAIEPADGSDRELEELVRSAGQSRSA